MKVIIAGCRNLSPTLPEVDRVVGESGLSIHELVNGGAPGVDKAAVMWAEWRGLPIKKFEADWSVYGNRAGPIRNGKMAEYADALIAIWDGKSPGTSDMIRQMKTHGKPVFVWDIKKRGVFKG